MTSPRPHGRDVLAALLESPKARGAFLLTSVLNPLWSLRIEDRAPLCLMTMVRGDAWVLPDRGEPVLLRPGDVAVVRGPAPYTVADDPGTPVRTVVGPGQRCTTVPGTGAAEPAVRGVRAWGDDLRETSSVMLSGTYQEPGEVGRRLLDAMPGMLVRPAREGDDALVGLLAAEMSKDEPGQEPVLDRLLDLLLVSVLRTWLAAPGTGAPACYRAQGDPVVGPALRLLHDDPAHPWTVASLAARVGASRAGLARRFTALVGEPPMAYLANWRLALAADLLRDTDATVAAVARQVGYSTPFALSAAFKRVRGVSPREYRTKGPVTCARPLDAQPRTVVLAP
ncbi:AraC family transcriptional regulator [Streptomyces thermolineatus]|uniref:AraC family transcriptional regulator n=1 Tax=Streptomyces thermolineatus TaxID=44033 RepID=A0ABN3LQU2_9ACTN